MGCADRKGLYSQKNVLYCALSEDQTKGDQKMKKISKWNEIAGVLICAALGAFLGWVFALWAMA